MDSGKNDRTPQPRAHGPLRSFLKLMVEFDSSRSLLHRFRAGFLLLALLAAFGAAGYFLPAWISKLF